MIYPMLPIELLLDKYIVMSVVLLFFACVSLIIGLFRRERND